MSPSLRRIIIMVFCLWFLVLLPVFAQSSKGVTVAILQANDINQINYTVFSPYPELSLVLRSLDKQKDIKKLILSLSPLERSDGVVGSPAALTFASGGVFTKTLLLKAGMQESIKLQGMLPQIASYTGYLVMDEGEQTVVYTLKITRQPALLPEVLEANGGVVVLPIGSSQYSRNITLYLPLDHPPLDDLHLNITSPSRQDGRIDPKAQLLCQGCGRQHMQPGDSITITLQARDLSPGTYIASLRIDVPGQSDQVELQLIRPPLLENLTVNNPGTLPTTRYFWLMPAWVKLPVSIRETEGQDTVIYPPRLTSLHIANSLGEINSLGSEETQLSLQTLSGQEIPLELTPTLTITLTANNQLAFIYNIRELPYSGSYQGDVQVSGSDSAMATQEVIITVKDAWYLVLAVIAVGVYLSYWLQQWTQKGRQTAIHHLRIARVRENLPSTEEDPIWLYLFHKLNQLQQDNELGLLDQSQVEANLKDIETRRDYYYETMTIFDQITILLDNYPAKPSSILGNKLSFEQRASNYLTQIKNSLQEKGGTLTEITQIITALSEMPRTIELSSIKEPAIFLQNQLQFIDSSNPAITGRVNALLTTVTDNILRKIEEDPPSVLRNRLQENHRQYANLLLEQLRDLVEEFEVEQETLPDPNNPRWLKMKQGIKRIRNGLGQAEEAVRIGQIDAALEYLVEVQLDYLTALVEQLDILASPTGKPTDIPSEVWNEWLNQTSSTIKTQLAEARSHLTTKAYPQAQQVYQRAQNEYTRISVYILDYHLNAFKMLTDKSPANNPHLQSLWQQLPQDEVQSVLAEIDTVQENLLTKADSNNEWPQIYHKVRPKAIQMQAKLLKTLLSRLELYSTMINDDSSWWKADFPNALNTIQRQIVSVEYNVSEKIQTAERTIGQAFADYKNLLNRISELGVDTGIQKLGRETPTFVHTDETPLTSIPVAPSAIQQLQPLSVPRQTMILVHPDKLKERTSKDWRMLISANDQVAIWAILAITAATGLFTLWVPNPTFGSITDYLTAFLWGFGLHKGLSDVIARFTMVRQDERNSA